MAKFNDPIENMQAKFKEIRLMFGISVTKFADLLGVTRQTIYNIESCKTIMTKVQYLAMRALVSDLLETYPDKRKMMDVLWEREYEKEELTKISAKYL